MKDNFSQGSKAYALFRPGYPDSLIDFLIMNCNGRFAAWDCGTGNGQLASRLSPHFDLVFGTDISDSQLSNTTRHPNIIYKKEAAESTAFTSGQFDLITVAQAIHWFRFDAFYREVYRTLKDDGLFAVIGYSLVQVSPEVDRIVRHFYSDIVGPYWDPERRYVDELYTTIPFPFDEMPAPMLTQEYQWTLEQLLGYLKTWSAVNHYAKDKGNNPVDLIGDELTYAWGDSAERTVTVPLLLRAGRKLSSFNKEGRL